ncbi:MAG TPA: Flp pilus assembly protein CpaB [Syntrophales bacterium]|nr:Flp pilus assembly protein CpaB [Syntrophales bacterium]HOX93680.1 Flp pilus assembly protein CpaB [Syntrophales bacterium]HPI56582.1 Flp pilus assembly protein CpaB [Syntrophales bacterium]HPN24997.1 Flp pilus assembly protein CpaB [Syntrophales bacterium]HQM29261.1 Flp pilus assembly protein CpaB [Syntrophales bacterium]
MKNLWSDLSDRSKTVILFSVAVLIALFVAMLSYSYLQKSYAAKNKTMETQQVVVAAADLTWGTSLGREYMKTSNFLKESLPSGYYADPALLEGRVILYPLKAGEPILESRLAPATMKGGGVAAVISPGKRAMAVKVDKVVGVAGFIHPGHRVDILVTLAQTAKQSTPITKIVLENILVLATGTEVEKTGKQEKPSQVDVITLEVLPQEGEKLALAATEGKLQLALRNAGDKDNVATRGTTIPALLSSHVSTGPQNPKPRVMSTTSEGPFTVELIKGNKLTQQTF